MGPDGALAFAALCPPDPMLPPSPHFARSGRAEWRIGGLLSSAYTCPSPLIDATWCIFPYLEPHPRPWLALLCARAQLSLYSLDSEEHRVPLPHGYTTVFPTPLGLLLLGVS
ncbi:hypothetical protein APUTEX25_004208 [Auxenochlorella protothecoides]|uniref:Anaphase-promoting complex subunit 1 n=2 Tax=Auxenochlorella protothecoides TaxID=3075 RepID=A0A3M7L5K0_AUXPR|nr:hypothetical protein APUTEX25_004208 [Auxenochlorella protothecoides]|eukprot:RMZ57374.1 hypothetical protein APUTEX25_004208 [Auxenochlorella protothecoides]